ncbi:hypothetical protein BCV69DRAFT_300100 [Microstroma glucosiphilum]|uniref:glutamate--tRNA ligase n=1 Tax=Pseudomicrostroma glucosiphilum TaxID=1684307 RepID=A0A316U627_9BASI|nr:hypothetical protein BCV69DRAFT_300100 [Pseudomicrostroma glucosiphilum]PWN19793.1 hypothetical protein BCV69DRAFT_300100 [Pseudomicrostroma glucosiphilum]
MAAAARHGVAAHLYSHPSTSRLDLRPALQYTRHPSLPSPPHPRTFHQSPSSRVPSGAIQIVSPKLPEDPKIKPDLPPSKPPRLRFAPSPTGQLHLGGLRTALFNHLFARRFGGKWLLRIEDTDQTRLVPGSLESMQEILQWAGLDWDEGPSSSSSSSSGPYVQSQRLDIYRHYSEELIKRGKAYRDFRAHQDEDPDAEVARRAVARGNMKRNAQEVKRDNERARIVARKGVQQYVPPDEEHAQKLIKSGKGYCVRLRMEPKETMFHDGVSGRLLFKPDIGVHDPILMKTDGWPTYHLASVVDDHLMGITHVLRGEEWLPSVPKHLAIYSAFGFTPPTFMHLPLLMNKDGTKLSKKTQDVHVSVWREMGYEPDAVLNYVSLMGYNHHGEEPVEHTEGEGNAREVLTLKDLIESFDPLRISRHRAVPFPPKLDYLNKRHLLLKANGPPTSSPASQSPDDSSRDGLHALYLRALPALKERFSGAEQAGLLTESYIKPVIQEMIGRVLLFKDLPYEARYLFEEPDYGAILSPEQIKKKGVAGESGGSAVSAAAAAIATGEKPDPFTEYKTRKVRKGTAAAARLPRFGEFIERAYKTMEGLSTSGGNEGGEWADRETLRSTFDRLLEELDAEQAPRESGSDRIDMMRILRFALFGGKRAKQWKEEADVAQQS